MLPTRSPGRMYNRWMIDLAFPPFRVLANMVCLAVLCFAQTTNQARLIVQTGRCGATALAFSPDGKLLATGCGDQARLWDVATQRQVMRIDYPDAEIPVVRISPNGRTMLVVTTFVDGANAARFLEIPSGREVRNITTRFHGAAVSDDWRVLLTGGIDAANPARLWDVATGQELQRFPAHAPSMSVAISADGRQALVAGSDGMVQLWDTSTGKQLWQFRGHESKSPQQTGESFFYAHSRGVLAVAFSPDGRSALTGSADGSVSLWDIPARRELRQLRPQSFFAEPPIFGVTFSPDGHRVLLVFADEIESQAVELWDLTAAGPLARWKPAVRMAGEIGIMVHACFSPDGHTVAIGGTAEPTLLWDAETGKEICRFDGHSDRVVTASFSGDGHLALLVDDFAAAVWDVAAGKMTGRVPGRFERAVLSPDGRSLATESAPSRTWNGDGAGSGVWNLWDISSGRQIAHLPDKERSDSDFREARVAFSSDGRLLLAVCVRCKNDNYGRDERHTGLVWDVAGGREVRRLELAFPVVSLAPSFDGKSAASIDFGTVSLWDIKTGSVLQKFVTPDPVMALSLDTRLAATFSYNPATGPLTRIWDLASGRELQRFLGKFVSLSPDGRQVTTSPFPRTVLDDYVTQVWDVASGNELRRLTLKGAPSTSLAGNFGLSVDVENDGGVRLWNVQTGKQVATLVSFDESSWAVIDPDGRFDTNNLDGRVPMHWILDSDPMRPLPLEIFMRDYYTPRLLPRIMSGEKLAPLRNIADIKNRVQPDVEIVKSEATPGVPNRVTVSVHAASKTDEARKQPSGLQDLRLFRDGQMVDYTEGPLKDDTYVFQGVQLPLSEKKVDLTAYAFNSERIKSATAHRDFAYTPTQQAKPNAYLVQIGVNHYQASGCELHFAVNDALKLRAALEERLKARGLGVKAVELVSTTDNSNATKDEIHKTLDAIAKEATPDDAFFLSFSGHGYTSPDGQFYILPSDTQGSCSDANAELLKNAISADELADWLRPIDAGEMTFILDSCYSAKSVETNDFKPGPMGSRGLGQLAYDKRLRILAASQSDAAALEDARLQQGLLSYVLTEQGLKEGKADWKPVDQQITLGEWLAYGVDQVPKLNESEKPTESGRGVLVNSHSIRGSQIPALFDFSKKDEFVIQK